MPTFGMTAVTVAAIVVGAAVALLPRGRTNRSLAWIAAFTVSYLLLSTAWEVAI